MSDMLRVESGLSSSSSLGGAVAPTSALARSGGDDLYVSELLSFSLERLNKEPDLLRGDADRVRRQLQEVAVSHHASFVAAAEAVGAVRSELQEADARLGALQAAVPRLQEECEAFSARAAEVVAKRKANKAALSAHGTMLDLLEAPALVDTCVRNGSFDEALDLEAFVSKVAAVHGNLPVVRKLREDVAATAGAMRKQLLARLRGAVQLPDCLRAIGYLRRLGGFDEHTLRLEFLRCREAFIAAQVAALDRSSPYDFLKRLTDAHRVHLFDITMQYRAIFASQPWQGQAPAQAEGSSSGGSEALGSDALLLSWATRRIDAYLQEVSALLPLIEDGGSLASVLEHCMYCGMSLGRVGLDFRGLLPPPFEACSRAMFVDGITAATGAFEDALQTHRWVALPAMAAATSRVAASKGDDDAAADTGPPYALMAHPPLASFVNGCLAALNELRHCAPPALQRPLAAELGKACGAVADALGRYHAARALPADQMVLFAAMCSALADVAAPYLQGCFSRVFGAKTAIATPRLGTAGVDHLAAAVTSARELAAACAPQPSA
mmetsp:Transcript_22711/g.70153  ORF Transcript_22711/g.70153 Transcript_22711/m.70153 type:complete len:554 (-) Transcript_22711:151-1812(-)